ncbi:MAG: uracil-DNA glycosylase [Pseudomonadota bacterium]
MEAAKPASGLAQVAAAQRLAADCTDLPSLRQALEAFDGCALKQTATQLVFADGSGDAKLMIIGEAPGRDEDEKGVPFVGAAGQLLDKILAATGLKRSEVYITNVVPWRPPGNRKPTPLETQICMPFMLRHIALAAPQVLLLLGGTPTTALTGLSQGITRLRGRWHDVTLAPDAKIQALPTFHPAYLLRQPSHKALVWQDMLLLQERLKH